MNKLTVAFLLIGDYYSQMSELSQTIEAAKRLKYQCETDVIFAADSGDWRSIPMLQMLSTINGIEVIYPSKGKLTPLQVMNTVMDYCKTNFITFSLLGDQIESVLPLFQSKLSEDDSPCRVFLIIPDVTGTNEFQPEANALYGWLKASANGIPLASYCVSSDYLRSLGPMDESPVLFFETERYFGMWICRNGEVSGLNPHFAQRRFIRELPSGTVKKAPENLAVRYATYATGLAVSFQSSLDCAVSFFQDLNEEDRRVFASFYPDLIFPHRQTKYNCHYRILVVGGHWEYHHNQICFFNFMEKLFGEGYATYRSIFEYNHPANIVLNYDFVIFTRCRSENYLQMLEMCQSKNIPNIYMIDDNWLSIRKDYPEMGQIFVEGNPAYDNFIHGLSLCKTAWVYNDTLKSDVTPYTKCVKKFKISVNLDTFKSETQRIRRDDEIYIGFSGSLRYNDIAFKALARYARRHTDTKLILIGYLSKAQELLFNGLNVIRIPFQSYGKYAKDIAAIRPDLLIAPLDDNHTSNSKCANKYIEAAAAGSVVLCSYCLPYSQYIVDGENGYFVDTETEDAWYQKLCEVLSDIPRLRRVQENAVHDIQEHYSVDRLLDDFVKKTTEIIQETVIEDD